MSYFDELNAIWDAVKESLCRECSPSLVNLRYGDLEVLSFDDNVITLSTASEFKYKNVVEKYLPSLEKEFSSVMGFDCKVKVVFTGTPTSAEKVMRDIKAEDDRTSVPERSAVSESSQKEASPKSISGNLPPNYKFEYTFDNFIVGGSNKFAHAACWAVSAKPAAEYNPLFIYGPSGLGKTHLLSAVVNEIKKKKPDTRVLYVKGDEFTNQMIEALSKQEMSRFHDHFRSCDILLLDDIQFIAGKTSTQEEFFHTFNTLYEEGKQIILTSDRPPKDIPTLEDRLKTRFEWGLIADIQPPDLELRIAIIKKKAEQVSITVPDDVLLFLAENLRSNIRQIEGAIKKLSALSFLSGQSITMDLAKGCITELLGGAEPVNVTVEKIFSAVQSKYSISKSDIVGKKRNKEIVNARHVAVFLIREITDMSFPSISNLVDKDYATVHASYDKMNDKYKSDQIFRIEMDGIMKDVRG